MASSDTSFPARFQRKTDTLAYRFSIFPLAIPRRITGVRAGGQFVFSPRTPTDAKEMVG